MTGEELKEYFATRFAAYKTQVYRLIKQAGGKVTHAYNTLKLEGLTLAEIIAIIRGEVEAHEQNHNYPHGETLAQLGGTTKASYDARAVNYFPKDAVPISKLPLVSTTINNTNKTITLPAMTAVYYGRKVVVPSKVLTLSSATRQYVKVEFDPTNIVGRTAQYTVDDSDAESDYVVVIGRVNLAAAVYTAGMFQVIRIGDAAISTTLRGKGIPSNTGTQAAPGTIAPEWFQ